MITVTLAALGGYALGVASYALITAWILRPRPHRAQPHQ